MLVSKLGCRLLVSPPEMVMLVAELGCRFLEKVPVMVTKT